MKVVFVSGNFQKYAIEAQCEIDGVRCEFYSDQSGGHLIDRATRQTIPMSITQLAFIGVELRSQAEDISKRIPMYKMESSDEQMETLLDSKLGDFKSKLKDITEQALSTLYSDCLPYILNDTQWNMKNIINTVIEKIIKGDFKAEIDNYNNYTITVTDQHGFEHNISERCDTRWGTLVEAIYKANPQAIIDARVRQLEEKVESLKASLNQAYSFR